MCRAAGPWHFFLLDWESLTNANLIKRACNALQCVSCQKRLLRMCETVPLRVLTLSCWWYLNRACAELRNRTSHDGLRRVDLHPCYDQCVLRGSKVPSIWHSRNSWLTRRSQWQWQCETGHVTWVLRVECFHSNGYVKLNLCDQSALLAY